MRIEVNEQNIKDYGLDELTDNSREELLRVAAQAEEQGYTLDINIPDTVGGDTEAPTERNAFEHYEDAPTPDTPTHEQDAVSLTETACAYRLSTYEDAIVNDEPIKIWICRVHNQTSKHDVDRVSNMPCLAIDPYETESI